MYERSFNDTLLSHNKGMVPFLVRTIDLSNYVEFSQTIVGEVEFLGGVKGMDDYVL